jgi:transcriptional regulator with XRE-family HTH domain
MKTPKIKTNNVKKIDDRATGSRAKAYRMFSNVKQCDLAAELNIQVPNLSAFESGNRTWTAEFFDKYIAGVDKLKAIKTN